MEKRMSIEGTWNVRIDSPLGEQQGILELRTDGSKLFGTGRAMGNTMTVLDGTVAGDNAMFIMEIVRPITILLQFRLQVAGNVFSGEARGPIFGSRAVRGERAPAQDASCRELGRARTASPGRSTILVVSA
jgi:hypothetical protein